jgi:hypothetical protein
VLLTALTVPASGSEFYYVAVFGSQRPDVNNPNHTHCFATFIRATGDGPCAEGFQVQAWTISWLSESLRVQVLRLLPECGTNFDLHPTLRLALADGQRVSMWGPYQIQKELFDRAVCQVAHLRSGAERYKTLDIFRNSERVSNCIHALSGVISYRPRLHVGVPTYGESASYFITLKYRPWMIEPCRTHDWLIGRLGLAGYPLVRRGLDRNPTEGPVLRTLQTASQEVQRMIFRN